MFEYATVAIVSLLAAISPGPDFVLVSNNSLMFSRKYGIYTALGISIGLLFHIFYTVIGLQAIIHESVLLFTIIKYCGAAYLSYLGIKLITSRHQGTAVTNGTDAIGGRHKKRKAFISGLLCNILNPKAGLFVLSFLSQMITPETTYLALTIYALEMVGITFLWFCVLAILLTHPKVKHVLLKAQPQISLVMGLLLIGFGLKIAFL